MTAYTADMICAVAMGGILVIEAALALADWLARMGGGGS